MNIKINKTLEVVLLFLLAMLIAGSVTYRETAKLTAHFMQIKTTQLVSYVPVEPEPEPEIQQMQEAQSSSAMSITRAILTPRPFTTTQRTAFQVAIPARPPVIAPLAQLPAAPEEIPDDGFPALERAIYPMSKAPNWGAMRTAYEWDRIYPEMNNEDFVEIPPYNLSELTVPMNSLTQNLTNDNIAIITAKLFYSTRYFGRYHLDSGEFEGFHAGIDFKLPAGMPVNAIAGGRVHATGTDDNLGNFIMILHKLPSTGEEVVSIYGHLERIGVTEGQDVKPGAIIGTVGSTGKSSGPHLHLQIDKKKSPGRHVLYVPDSAVSREEASNWTLHPIEFIARW